MNARDIFVGDLVVCHTEVVDGGTHFCDKGGRQCGAKRAYIVLSVLGESLDSRAWLDFVTDRGKLTIFYSMHVDVITNESHVSAFDDD